MAEGSVRIDIRQVCPGLYISLGERWIDHDFLFNSFRLSSQAQIAKLREMGLTHIEYFPARSTVKPLPFPTDSSAGPVPAQSAHAGSSQDQGLDVAGQPGEQKGGLTPISGEAREARMERVAARRAELARCEKAYLRSVEAVRSLMADVFIAPREAREKASDLVDSIVADLVSSQHAVVNLMSDSLLDTGVRYHSLNVTILSLLLGRTLGLPAQALNHLGMGALMHDLGKVMVPAAVLRIDAGLRNRHQEAAYRQHVEHGTQLCGQLGIDQPEVLDIIRNHHERLDGQGFPHGLAGEQISVLTRVVSIANRFDGLCHTIDPARAMTPAEALASMYRRESAAFDLSLMQRFIKCLGVWPAGTLVQLSNGAVALVTAVAPEDTLRPTVMVGDPSVPRAEALIVDLREAQDVRIERALRPAELEPAALAYLLPRMGSQVFVGRDVGN
jgi:putative nucleotidyltransferase with HDIG domain